MANLYHKDLSRIGSAGAPEDLHAAVTNFLSQCKEPAVLEYGDELLPLLAGQFTTEVRAGRLWLDAWHEQRSLSRRLLAISHCAPGVLECVIQRFGGVVGQLTLLDAARPQTAHRKLAGTRRTFGEQFRRMLQRHFPGWPIEALSSGMDLRRSFSPVYPRAKLVRGSRQIAALGCPDAVSEPGLLTFAILWFDYLKSRAPRDVVQTELCLFLPDGSGALTAHRLRWMHGQLLPARLFLFNEHGSAGEVDPQDLGNLETRVLTHSSTPAEDLPVRLPVSDSSERHLEQAVRANVQLLEPEARPAPVHGQVISFAAADRDLIDLLAISFDGRLIVLELKITEDIHLPLQALDYWLRVQWHVQRGELARFFAGLPMGDRPPLLRLVAPALSFHPTAATILRYFSPEVDVERIGINLDWACHFQVILRLRGGDEPQSHGGQYGRAEFSRYQEGNQQHQSRTRTAAERSSAARGDLRG